MPKDRAYRQAEAQPAPVVREWVSVGGMLMPEPWKTTSPLSVVEAIAEHNALYRAYLAKCAESDARLTSWAECRGLLSKARAEVEGLKEAALHHSYHEEDYEQMRVSLERETARAEAAEARAKDCRANELAAIEQMQAAEARTAKLLEALEEIAHATYENRATVAMPPTEADWIERNNEVIRLAGIASAAVTAAKGETG